MNEAVQAKRRFWRIHLSTAVLLSFAAGGIGWANSQLRFTELPPSANPLYRYNTGDGLWNGCLERGRPVAFYRVDALLVSERYNGLTPDKVKSRFAEEDKRGEIAKNWLYVEGRGVAFAQTGNTKPCVQLLNGFLDSAVGLAFLFLLTFVCEYLIRRREGRKT